MLPAHDWPQLAAPRAFSAPVWGAMTPHGGLHPGPVRRPPPLRQAHTLWHAMIPARRALGPSRGRHGGPGPEGLCGRPPASNATPPLLAGTPAHSRTPASRPQPPVRGSHGGGGGVAPGGLAVGSHQHGGQACGEQGAAGHGAGLGHQRRQQRGGGGQAPRAGAGAGGSLPGARGAPRRAPGGRLAVGLGAAARRRSVQGLACCPSGSGRWWARAAASGGSLARASARRPLPQVPGCTSDLTSMREYHQRYKICEFHLKAQAVVKDGTTQRFCQQVRARRGRGGVGAGEARGRHTRPGRRSPRRVAELAPPRGASGSFAELGLQRLTAQRQRWQPQQPAGPPPPVLALPPRRPAHPSANPARLNRANGPLQCGKFQLVEEFDGEKRSCRARLEKHNARRRRQREMQQLLKKGVKLDPKVRRAALGRAGTGVAVISCTAGYARGTGMHAVDPPRYRQHPAMRTYQTNAPACPALLARR